MRTLKVVPYSPAEDKFVNKLMPVCKDKVVCRLGALFGWPYNEYVITEEDFQRIKTEILKEKKES